MRKLTVVVVTVTALVALAVAAPAQARTRLSNDRGLALAQNYLLGDWKALTARAQAAHPSVSLSWCRGYVGGMVERGSRRKLAFSAAAICRTADGADVTTTGTVVVRLTRRYGPVFHLRPFAAVR